MGLPQDRLPSNRQMSSSIQGPADTRFSGTENLEVMRDAVNYNRYLLDLIRGYAGNAKRVIDFGAGLLVYVPAFQALYTSMDANVGHVRRYSRDALVRSVSAAGFAVETVEFVDSLGYFATLAFKLTDRGSGDVNPRMLRLYDRTIFPVSRVLDRIFHRWFGKNLLLVARNP